MSAKMSLTRRRSAALALASFAAGSCALYSAGSAGAMTDLVCAGTNSYNNLGIELAQIGSESVDSSFGAVAVRDLMPTMVAGQYSITTTAYDGYVGRSVNRPAELSEKYYIEFLDDQGNVVGATGTTPELPDDADYVEASATFQVTLTGTATQVRYVQVIDYIAPGDLVHVGCLGMTFIVPPTTTTSTSTTSTLPPTTSTTATPPTTATTVVSEPPPSTLLAVVPTSPPVTTATRTLPVTGSRSGPLAAAGVLFVAAGAGLVVRARRKE